MGQGVEPGGNRTILWSGTRVTIFGILSRSQEAVLRPFFYALNPHNRQES